MPDFKLKQTDKGVSELEINEMTWPRQSGRFRGVSVGLRKEGYFVFTHRARSNYFPRPSSIPESVIAQIRSTGYCTAGGGR